MRKQGSGIIVNISSMGGRIAFPLSSTYSGTKYALEAISDSLSYEVEQFGIKFPTLYKGSANRYLALIVVLVVQTSVLSKIVSELKWNLSGSSDVSILIV